MQFEFSNLRVDLVSVFVQWDLWILTDL